MQDPRMFIILTILCNTRSFFWHSRLSMDYLIPTYRAWFSPVVSGRVWHHREACSMFLWPVYPAMGTGHSENIAPGLTNSLPQHLKDTHDISRFQHSLKTHLFRLAYADIEWNFLLVLLPAPLTCLSVYRLSAL